MKLNTNRIPVQPVFSSDYFQKKKSKLPNNISSQLYLSWEDGLWDIIESFEIKKNSIILVPSFFCVDVMNNMKDHGLFPIYYEVDENLQPNKADIESKIKRQDVIFLVLFHAVGITNKLVTKEFIQKLSKRVIVIEDCVHKITDPSRVTIYSKNHILINSFRKVVPLQGSLIFGDKIFISQLKGAKKTVMYSWAVIILWFFMQVSYVAQKYIHNSFGLLAQWFMLRGYDIIGDEKKAGYCPEFFAVLYQRLDFERIKTLKKQQVQLYSSLLKGNNKYYVPFFNKTDEEELRGYPIVMEKHVATLVISKLREQQLFIRKELNDSLWTTEKSIIYLPLGLHIENEDIKAISSLFNNLL